MIVGHTAESGDVWSSPGECVCWTVSYGQWHAGSGWNSIDQVESKAQLLLEQGEERGQTLPALLPSVTLDIYCPEKSSLPRRLQIIQRYTLRGAATFVAGHSW